MDVPGAVGLDGIDGLVDHAQAELADYGFAGRVFGADVVSGRLTGLELRLRRRKRDRKFLLIGGDLQIFVAGVEGVVFDEHGRNPDVGLVVGPDGNRNHHRLAIGFYDLPGLDGAAFGGHQDVGIGHSGHDEEMGGVTGLIGLFVGDDLDGFVGLAAPGFFTFADGPQPGATFDLAAFGCLGRDPYLQVAIAFGGELEISAAGGPGMAVACIVHGFVAASSPVMLGPYQLGVEGGAHRLAIVIAGHGGELDGLAFLVHESVGFQANLEASIGGHHRVVPGNFAAALVGNPGLDAVAIIVLVLGKRGGNGDLQSAAGVQLAGLLGKLFAGILVFVAARAVASIFTLALSFATSAAVHVVHILIAK